MSSNWISLGAGLLLFECAAQIFAQNAPASVSVDAKAARHAISPNIYGFAFGSTSDLAATGFTMNREGGDLASTYNWKIDATDHANDWYFETFLDPGYDSDTFITQTRAANVGAQPLMTTPMLGYLGNLGPGNASLWSFSRAKYGPQTGWDPYQPDAGNGISTAAGNPHITGNNPLDANVPNSVSIQQAWVQHLIGTWGNAAAGGLKYYIMDNEPSLWNSTHRDVHPAPETYDELYNDYVAYAGAVRSLDPNAIIAGPEEWNWWAMFLSGLDQANGLSAAGSDYNTHKQTYYYPWLLQQLYAYQQKTGNQLLNVLSVHYYPQELSNSDDDSLSGQLIRNQSTRVLWDANYVDPSWLNQVGINNGIVNLIPTLKGFVSQYYPGLQTAITEYNWGDEANLNGATTQADVLGIFGREGLDIATRWTVPANPSPTYLALEIYRNYDGKLSAFGDTSVSDVVANPDLLSSFSAVRTSDGALTVMVINKQQGTTPVTISLANFPTTGTAQAWQIASATQASITLLSNVPVAGNAISATLPSQSITLFVIPAGSMMSLSQTTINFGVNSGGVGGGVVTDPQNVTVSFSGASASWTASSNQSNVVVSPTSGTGLGTLTITASAGPSATIYVTAVNATNPSQTIAVNIGNVTPGVPFGSFDTPVTSGNPTFSGAIGATGWALDSIEVTGVDIWREPVTGEPGTTLIFIGNADFVPGARPDVQADDPTTPFSYRAGWGLQILTNELPNSSGSGPIGNGTFNIHAIAHNKSGSQTDLGTKTITVNNAAATLPFGTIDTPTQGQTVSGTVVNFGWALTPPTVGCPGVDQPCIIPVNGLTLIVYIDSNPVGNPVYNFARCDVDQDFPNYANSGSTNCANNGTSPGPVGYYTLDTTTLTNGLHAIQWSVTDNAGRVSGIGSRYFTVAN